MARIVELECWNCRHVWRLDLEQNQDKMVVYRGEPIPTDSYSFSCPTCGKANVIDVPSKGASHDG